MTKIRVRGNGGSRFCPATGFTFGSFLTEKAATMKALITGVLGLLFLASTLNASAQDQLRTRDRIHQEDHLRLTDGKLYLLKNGQATEATQQVTLPNGTVVNPDGSYMLQNRQRFQLRNGECLDMNGNRYMNQRMFNRRVMMTNKQIERAQNQMMNRGRAGGSRQPGGRPN